MQRTVDQSLDDVEAILFVLSARERIGAGDRFIAERVFALGIPVVIALNKVDRLKPGHIAEQMARAAQLGDFYALHPVSAVTGDGVDALRDELVALLPEGPAYYSREQRTDLEPELQIAELVREKALQLTREEGPHALSVQGDELADKVVRATIFVETESQKQIVIGKGGAVVKQIGTRPRPEDARTPRPVTALLALFDVDVTLFLTDGRLAIEALLTTLRELYPVEPP